MRPRPWVALALALAPAACATAPPPAGDPAPDVDDLDPDTLRGPKLLGPPRIIDAERLEAVVARLPFHGTYDLVADKVVKGTATWTLRRAAASEPPGYVQEYTTEAHLQHLWMRESERRYYAAAPPHRLTSLVRVSRNNRDDVRTVVRNGSATMTIAVTEHGTPQPLVSRPPSRETLAAQAIIFVDPELVSVGATQTLNQLDVDSQRDVVVHIEVVGKGPWRVEGATMPTVVFEDEVEGRVAVAGGRLLLGFNDRSGEVRARRRPGS